MADPLSFDMSYAASENRASTAEADLTVPSMLGALKELATVGWYRKIARQQNSKTIQAGAERTLRQQ
jgi:hypothetical protein